MAELRPGRELRTRLQTIDTARGHTSVYLEWGLALLIMAAVPWLKLDERVAMGLGLGDAGVPAQVVSAWRGAWLALDAQLWPERLCGQRSGCR